MSLPFCHSMEPKGRPRITHESVSSEPTLARPTLEETISAGTEGKEHSFGEY